MGTRCSLGCTGFFLLRGLPDKVVDNLNSLRPLAIDLLRSINENPVYELVQNGGSQF
ncbi:hypothetical protein SDC9_122835 [bioreactor metagenome]|uniref:Uncharacterized protein n=1 Tax=bioreactor metagenome TaxID=1076179 RepID=A0A645CG13_9ZZZZ